MSAYKRVYSPDGEAFDVATARANDLILQHGWTQQPPVDETPEPEEAPKKTRRSRKKVEEKPVEAPVEEKEEQSDPEDIDFFGDVVETD